MSPSDLSLVVPKMPHATAAGEHLSARPTAPAAVERRRRGRSLWSKLIAASTLAILACGNAWWYWRDARKLPEMNILSEWVRRERYDQVEPVLREKLRRSPHDGEARMMLARVVAGRGDLAGCARELAAVPFWWPSKPEALFREGQSYLKINRAKDAETAWLRALNDDPLHRLPPELFHDISQELLKLYAIEDRWEDAYPIIWMAYDRAPERDQPVYLAMRMRPELERVAPRETVAILERYVAAAADDWEATRALGRALQALGNVEEATRLFERCLAGERENLRAWHNLLALFLAQGDRTALVALLAKAPAGAELESDTWFFRGIARENDVEPREAAACFNKAIALNPFVPKYYYRLATVEQRLGLYTDATSHRARSKALNEARARLGSTFTDYYAAIERPDGAGDVLALCRQLASICETLGWARAAKAWTRLTIVP
jgi:tetratricopeptide (TPR) repeat protein